MRAKGPNGAGKGKRPSREQLEKAQEMGISVEELSQTPRCTRR
ncbi:hypothetical protein P4S68_14470 [Pseudoalteromonas sp. Hal099]